MKFRDMDKESKPPIHYIGRMFAPGYLNRVQRRHKERVDYMQLVRPTRMKYENRYKNDPGR